MNCQRILSIITIAMAGKLVKQLWSDGSRQLIDGLKMVINMEKISGIIHTQVQKTISPKHKVSQLEKWRSNLSKESWDDVIKFKKQFPTVINVYNFFCFKNVAYAVEHEYDCVTKPCISLSDVDNVYESKGIAQTIVRNLIVGVYLMGAAHEQMREDVVNNAASLFVSKYGHYCTLYGIMLYFGYYVTEYKTTFLQFDVQDILLQFGKKFLPWWQKRSGRECNNEDCAENEICGKEALYNYIMRKIEKGDELKTGSLYKCGLITDDMIDEVKEKLKSKCF